MLTATKILCRLWRCAVPSEPARHGSGAGASRDDLTAIRGIGIATQDRLYRAGIRSFSQLAQASPERLREILGSLARGARVETWIKDAAGQAKAK
jgi:predicted flap endonuclease-1-like 5' DNA nuclease